jgi:hypothetical protein
MKITRIGHFFTGRFTGNNDWLVLEALHPLSGKTFSVPL